MSPRMPGTKRSRPGGVFLSGQAVSLLGDGLAVLAIPLLVLDLSRDPLALALSAASVTVGYLVVGLPAGVLVDRMDPWRVLGVMDGVRALLFAGLFAFASAGTLTVWLILLIAFAAGACSVFFETALRPAVARGWRGLPGGPAVPAVGQGAGEPGQPHAPAAGYPTRDAGQGHQRGPGALPGRGPARGGDRGRGDVRAGR